MDTLNNILNGALGSILGSIVGVIGAYYLAVNTIQRTLRNDRALTQEKISIEAAGTIAVSLVNFYDLLGELMQANRARGSGDLVEIAPAHQQELAKSMRELNRDITIEATLLAKDLADKLGVARRAMRETFGVSATAAVSKSQLLELRQTIRDAGDSLRDYRRRASSI
jgi:hypothetical protein